MNSKWKQSLAIALIVVGAIAAIQSTRSMFSPRQQRALTKEEASAVIHEQLNRMKEEQEKMKLESQSKAAH
ncbi:hypothetical protein V22_16180 [Calycomorphotria hydatis]|uniref:Uncharacterized protein n=1 Tax=Calycomorphotria hydatis TaxID=2528027 RepID=A0A517T7N4_9PLAN|nr:hypothetical protein V22_16180 [Calycomorphotria hydatis]